METTTTTTTTRATRKQACILVLYCCGMVVGSGHEEYGACKREHFMTLGSVGSHRRVPHRQECFGSGVVVVARQQRPRNLVPLQQRRRQRQEGQGKRPWSSSSSSLLQTEDNNVGWIPGNVEEDWYRLKMAVAADRAPLLHFRSRINSRLAATSAPPREPFLLLQECLLPWIARPLILMVLLQRAARTTTMAFRGVPFRFVMWLVQRLPTWYAHTWMGLWGLLWVLLVIRQPQAHNNDNDEEDPAALSQLRTLIPPRFHSRFHGGSGGDSVLVHQQFLEHVLFAMAGFCLVTVVAAIRHWTMTPPRNADPTAMFLGLFFGVVQVSVLAIVQWYHLLLAELPKPQTWLHTCIQGMIAHVQTWTPWCLAAAIVSWSSSNAIHGLAQFDLSTIIAGTTLALAVPLFHTVQLLPRVRFQQTLVVRKRKRPFWVFRAWTVGFVPSIRPPASLGILWQQWQRSCLYGLLQTWDTQSPIPRNYQSSLARRLQRERHESKATDELSFDLFGRPKKQTPPVEEEEPTIPWQREIGPSVVRWTMQKAAQHEQDLQNKNFKDPLGIALQQTLGIGLSFEYNHYNPNDSDKVGLVHLYRARLAKSVIVRLRQMQMEESKRVQEEKNKWTRELLTLVPLDEAFPATPQDDNENEERVVLSRSDAIRLLAQREPVRHKEDEDERRRQQRLAKEEENLADFDFEPNEFNDWVARWRQQRERRSNSGNYPLNS